MKNPTPSIKRFTHISPLRNSRGFTLMELLVVVAIIVILAALSLGGMNFAKNKQALEKCKSQMKMLESALEEYKLDNGRYPIAVGNGSNTLYRALYWDSNNDNSGVGTDTVQKVYLNELDPASNKQGWSSNPVASAANTIKDPWGNDYNYRSGSIVSGAPNPDAINPDFDLWSFGPDGQAGTATGTDKASLDNITNWK